jgi:hypothetical protein
LAVVVRGRNAAVAVLGDASLKVSIGRKQPFLAIIQ